MQAVTAVEHRKASYGRGKGADQPETGISDVAQVGADGCSLLSGSRRGGPRAASPMCRVPGRWITVAGRAN
jgi:hypothetical protein